MLSRVALGVSSLVLALNVACSQSGQTSSVMEGEDQSLPNYALNDNGLKAFSAGIREALANRLLTAKFPFYDKQPVEVLGQVESSGESWMRDPVNTLVLEIYNMQRIDGSPRDWSFELKFEGPVEGTVKVVSYTQIFGQTLKSNLVNTTYTADLKTRFYGKLHYEPLVENEEVLVDIQAICDNIDGHLENLEFGGGLISHPVVEDILQTEINGLIVENKERLLGQANASIKDAAQRGEMRADLQEFYSIIPAGM